MTSDKVYFNWSIPWKTLFLTVIFLMLNSYGNTLFAQINKSLILDGRSNYYEVNHHSDLNSQGAMTIEFWIKPNCIDYVFIFSKQRCNGQFGYSLAIKSGKLVWTVSPNGQCTNNSVYETDSAVIKTDSFTHVALVQNQTSINIYINGTLVSGSFVQGSAIAPRASTRPFLIGAYTSLNGSKSLYASGMIDEFRFWKTGLTANQINQRMNDTLLGNEQDLVLYFNMEFNSTGNNANLTNRANTGSTFDATIYGSSTNTPYFSIDSIYDALPFQLPDTIHSCKAYNQNTNISSYYHSLTWNTGQTSQNINLMNRGLYHLEMERERCKIFRDTLFFDRQNDITIEETIDKCRGKTIDHRLFTIDENKTYRDTIPAPNGCDSLFTINVNLLPDIERDEQYEICVGKSMNIHNLLISAEGIYYDTLIGTIGCDTIVTINVTKLPYNHEITNLKICPSDTLFIGNQIITQKGTYYDTISSINECDTIVTINVEEQNYNEKNDTLEICKSDTLFLGNQIITQKGTYFDTIPSINGCDTIVAIYVEELPYNEKNDTLEICKSDTLFIGNQIITQIGTYYDTLQSINGCDTISTIRVIQKANYEKYENYKICRGKALNIKNLVIQNPGLYTDTIFAPIGCDTTLIIEVDQIPDILSQINLQICNGDSVLVGAQIIKEAGQFYDTLTATTIGCDTIVEYTVEIKNFSDTNITLLACDGQYVDFLGYPLSYGTDTQFIIQNYLECDSVINVKVNKLDTRGFLEREIVTCENSFTLSSPSPSTTWNNSETSSNLTVNESGVYYGSFYDENGCLVSDTSIISFIRGEIYIPNAFSPNEDILNECFKPLISEGTEIANYRFLIYNRWGELVLQTNDPLFCWDGTHYNEKANDGVYFYILTGYINDCKKVISESGLIHLVR